MSYACKKRYIDHNPVRDVEKPRREVGWHDLRHTYASIQLDLDVNIKYLQSQMGHATINITLDTYSHLLRNENSEAAARLGDAIFATGHKMVTNGARN